MESERKIKKRKMKKIKIIISIAVVIVCLLSWLFVNSHFVKGLIYRNASYENNTVLEVDKSIAGSYSVFGNHIIFTTKNGVAAYNLKGELVLTSNFDAISSEISSYDSPVVKSSGKYMFAYDSSGRDIIIFNESRIIHKIRTEYTVQSVKSFDNGYFAAITGDAGAKNQMILYNPDGKRIFVWHSGTDNIIDAAISPNGKKTVVLASELSEGNLNSKLLFFNEKEAEAYASKKYDGVFITDIDFINNSLITAVSDLSLYYINTDGNEKSAYSYNDRFLNFYAKGDNGRMILCFGSLSDSLTETEIINQNGRLKGKYVSENSIIGIDYKNNNIVLTSERSADIISMGGHLLRHIDFAREMNKVLFVGRNKLVLIGNSEIKIIR